MKYFSKLFGMFSKSSQGTTAPDPAPVAEPLAADAAGSAASAAPSIDGD